MTDQAIVKKLFKTMGSEHITATEIDKINCRSCLVGLIHDLFEMVQTAYDAGRIEGLSGYNDYDKELEIFGYSEDFKEDRVSFTNEQANKVYKCAQEFYEIQNEIEYEMYDEMSDIDKKDYTDGFIEK